MHESFVWQGFTFEDQNLSWESVLLDYYVVISIRFANPSQAPLDAVLEQRNASSILQPSISGRRTEKMPTSAIQTAFAVARESPFGIFTDIMHKFTGDSDGDNIVGFIFKLQQRTLNFVSPAGWKPIYRRASNPVNSCNCRISIAVTSGLLLKQSFPQRNPSRGWPGGGILQTGLFPT